MNFCQILGRGWWTWALVSPDGVVPGWMVGVSASVNFPCAIKSKRSVLAPAHPGGPGKRAIKQLWWCGVVFGRGSGTGVGEPL